MGELFLELLSQFWAIIVVVAGGVISAILATNIINSRNAVKELEFHFVEQDENYSAGLCVKNPTGYNIRNLVIEIKVDSDKIVPLDPLTGRILVKKIPAEARMHYIDTIDYDMLYGTEMEIVKVEKSNTFGLKEKRASRKFIASIKEYARLSQKYKDAAIIIISFMKLKDPNEADYRNLLSIFKLS